MIILYCHSALLLSRWYYYIYKISEIILIAGQEITIKYVNEELKKFKDRQEYFYSYGGFVCSCELCQEENIYNNDEVYEKFQKLQEEVKIILNVLHYENEAQ